MTKATKARKTKETKETTGKRRLLLVEDDPTFATAVTRLAEKRGFDVTLCRSFAELMRAESLKFHVAILDYNLEGNFTGVHVAQFLSGAVRSRLPVLLVSSSEQCLQGVKWVPDSVQRIRPKTLGPQAILDEAISLLDSVDETTEDMTRRAA